MDRPKSGVHNIDTYSEKVFSIPGSFTIVALDVEGSGIDVQTDNLIVADTFLQSESYSSPDSLHLSDDGKRYYYEVMEKEGRFNGFNVEDIQSLEADFKQGAINKETYLLRRQDLWKKYRLNAREGAYKIGIRNIKLSDTSLAVDVKPVPFFVYNHFSSPEANEEERQVFETAATASIAVTQDNRLILQHRAIRNSQYAETIGASIAGQLDAKVVDDPLTGELYSDPIDNNFIISNSDKEAGEELGVDPSIITSRVIGLAYDERKPHHEFLVLTKIHLTSDELRKVSRDSSINKNLGDADFEEKYIDIEASPEAIFILLSQVKCPIPSTHTAGFVATGYSMMLEREGKTAADLWKKDLERAIITNTEDIDNIVASFYTSHPEAASLTPERYWGTETRRNIERYDTAFTPEEQGLPSLTNELVRCGLIDEYRRSVPEVHMYDIDGVLTNPGEKKTDLTELYDIIASDLNSGIPVSFNTGRSVEWVVKYILPHIKERTSETGLQNLLIVGEKGNSWASYDGENFSINVSKDTLSDTALADIQRVADEYESIVGILEVKRTMATLEMNVNSKDQDTASNLQAFNKVAPEILEKIELIFDKYDLKDIFRVDKTTIAIDIESIYAGKDLGAERMFAFLNNRDIDYSNALVTTYGDSESDIKMAEAASRHALKAIFVYTGEEKNIPTVSKSSQISLVNSPGYDSGTLSYHLNLKSK